MSKNIILTGVGGQGTVLASKLIAAAAMAKGLPVMSAETIGMAQRGGSVFSHLRIGEGVRSPMIADREGDLIIGFEPGETLRMLHFLKPGGQVITAVRPVIPVTSALSGDCYDGRKQLEWMGESGINIIKVDTDRAVKELRNPRVSNVVLLGAAAATGALGITIEDLKTAIRERLPDKLHSINELALSYGAGMTDK